MIPIRKNKVQILVVWFLIFLTLNCFVLEQTLAEDPPKPPPGSIPSNTSGNQAPKILSIEISGTQKYIITIEIEDEDPDTVTIHIEGYINIRFEKRDVEPISDTMKKGVFSSGYFHLDPGPHTLTIIVKDSEGNMAKMNVIIVVSEISIERKKENISPQIFPDINIQEKICTITVEVIDEDPHSVNIQIEENTLIEFKEIEITPISDNMKRGIFVSGSIPCVSGLQVLTITARDPQGEKTSKQISIKSVDTNQLPQIISLDYENEQNNYTIKTRIQDEDLGTVTVKIKGKPDVTFKKQITSENEGTFISDPIHLDPGSYPFTIVATNSRNKSTEMTTTINVPKKEAGSLLFLLLIVLVAGIAFFAIFFSRSRQKQEYLKDLDTIPGLKETDSAFYTSEIRDLKSELYHTRQRLERTEKDFEDYRESMEKPSLQEEEAFLRAQDAYQDTMTELKRAHGALDVKILELFMKRARNLLEEPAPHGQKLLNYEASKKLSDWVQTLLNDSELRTRLKKLREVGYLDPFGMT
jgi:hypothetical protein